MATSTTLDPRQDAPKINGDLQDVAREVHEKFDELLDSTTVDESLERVSAKFAKAKVRSFVSLLVRRYVNDELRERVGPGLAVAHPFLRAQTSFPRL
jgi:hypothetical protein